MKDDCVLALGPFLLALLSPQVDCLCTRLQHLKMDVFLAFITHPSLSEMEQRPQVVCNSPESCFFHEDVQGGRERERAQR